MKQKATSRTSSFSSWATTATAALTTGGLSTAVPLILASIVFGALLWIFVRRFVRPGKGRLPPGPNGLPLVGITPFLGPNPQLQLTEWGKKYGNVFSMYMGQSLTVVLNDYEAIKAGYIDQGETFAGRPDNFLVRVLSRGYRGVIATEGTFWREQRRLLLRSFHELGVGKSRFEQICMEEAQCLVDAMLAHGSAEPFNPRHEIDSSIANIIVGLAFGIRFERKDPKLRRFLDNQYVITSLFSQAGPLQVLPKLRYLPPYSAKFKRFTEVVQYGRDIIEPEVFRIEKEYDPKTQEPSCVVEFFLQKRANDFGTDAAARQKAEQDQFSNMLNIITNIQVLFGAGTETSVSTLTWCILFLLRYPQVQQRCYDDIVEHVGTERPVNWDDRNSLPYVDAFLHEVWRRSNLVPLGVLRRTLADSKLNGYFIPKGTWLIPNMWNVHRDPRHWDEPLKFNPQRFLQAGTKTSEENGTAKVSGDKMNKTLTNMPFGTGKRQCAGEGIARMEIFIFLATLIQQIEFCHAPEAQGGKVPSEDEFTTGITVQPAHSFNVCVRPRAPRQK